MNPISRSTLAVHRLTLYNASRLTDDEVIASFAARKAVLDRILADLRAEKPESRAQHHLIVGQRGMGKTMLLARIAADLRTGELAGQFIPLVFAEEQYSVDRLSKFWLNCLDSLADASEFANQPETVAQIDSTVTRLKARLTGAVRNDESLAKEALDAFLEAAQSTGQRPILLVDNLQLVFERLSKAQQHSLRELLMRPGSPILVGASPSPPPESRDYGAAFYDHFKVHYLRPLELEEMRALMLHLAEASGRDDVRNRVLQHPARLAVLRQLTGGNPRTTVTLFFLYAEDFAPTVFGDLENLLDRVTPLYKSRFEELTPQQQVIASAIANAWDPVTGSALAEDTRLPAGTISSQLDRLEKTGFIEKVELFGESRTGYQIAERFFNIWFLMRSASRKQRAALTFFTRFLQTFYSNAMSLNTDGDVPTNNSGGRLQDNLNPSEEATDAFNIREALVAAYDSNWGITQMKLTEALNLASADMQTVTWECWMRASAVLLHLNYGAELLAFLENRGDDKRLRPWYEALRALHLGDRRHLQNVAPEIRPPAESFYDEIERQLKALPEQTRRRPLPAASAQRRSRRRTVPDV